MKAVRCQLRDKDLVNWLTTSAAALGEAGPGALKRAILARDAQRKTDLVAEMATLQTIADDVSVSSWEAENGYVATLDFYRRHHGERGVGYRSVAKRFSISWSRLKRLVERDSKRRYDSRAKSDSSYGTDDLRPF